MNVITGGLTVYESLSANGNILVARDGELEVVISTGLAAGTSYYLPSSNDFVRAQEWGEKTFLVQADQPLSVDVLSSEDPGMTSSSSAAGTSFNTVKGMSISATQFVPNNWNTIDTTDNLNLVQLRVTTQGSAPSKIKLTVRFRKM